MISCPIRNIDCFIVRMVPSVGRKTLNLISQPVSVDLNEINKNMEVTIPDSKPPAARSISITPPSGADEISSLASAFDDVAAKLKKREQQLQMASKKLSHSERLESVNRLSSAIIHEISNPLSTISSYTQILLKKKALAPNIRKMVQTIEEETDRISSHIHSLLSLTRDSELNINPTHFSDFIEKIISVYTKIGNEKAIEVISDMTPVGTVNIDAGKLYESLTNIMFNAFDAIGQNGSVTFTTRVIHGNISQVPYQIRGTHEEIILIEIEDSGPGIPERILNQIFDPFFTTKPAGKGTGMGLSIAMKTIEGHGGALTAGNSARGAVFRIYLPLIAHTGNPPALNEDRGNYGTENSGRR